MSADRLRLWSRLTYHDPEEVLREMRRHERMFPGRRRRTHALKPHLEGRQAALFAHGLGARLGTRVSFAFAPQEALDHDHVLHFRFGEGLHWWPLQCKELPPTYVNRGASLERLLAGLDKYGSAPDLCVAVYVNRMLPASTLSIPTTGVGSLWFVGGADQEAHRWTLHGDLLQPDCRVTEFVYPEPRIIV